MRSIDFFRTRSYQEEPLRYVNKKRRVGDKGLAGYASSFDVFFGAYRFKLALQSARRGFGSLVFLYKDVITNLYLSSEIIFNEEDSPSMGGAPIKVFLMRICRSRRQ